MILKTWDEHSDQERSTNPTRAVIEEAIRELDWESEHLAGITLERDGENWADGSGSLHPEVGLSLMIEDNGVQHVGLSAPTSLDQIVEFLDMYLRGDMTGVYELLYEREFSPDELAELRATAEAEQSGSVSTLALVAVAFVVFGLIVWSLVFQAP